ncbi:MAG: deoxyribose-phosphate aldolase [Clostridia bacterium]|nr:deoxyribose-phosphate aldolase [Clostridia bacterium]
MDKYIILSHCDHTLLGQASTFEEIKVIVDDGIKYRTASVCIPPSFVQRASEYAKGRVPICTVIGFPNGYNTTEVKVFETKDAIEKGAEEIDMVINIGELRAKNYAFVENEIRAVKAACGKKILKVIIETCLLTDEEKIKMCELVTKAGADYIKTSTGFSKAGATREDIKLFSENIGPKVKMKAAGGIRSMQDAQDFLALGCSRLGTSSIVKIVKAESVDGSNY